MGQLGHMGPMRRRAVPPCAAKCRLMPLRGENFFRRGARSMGLIGRIGQMGGAAAPALPWSKRHSSRDGRATRPAGYVRDWQKDCPEWEGTVSSAA
jgi:hypothetical protein